MLRGASQEPMPEATKNAFANTEPTSDEVGVGHTLGECVPCCLRTRS